MINYMLHDSLEAKDLQANIEILLRHGANVNIPDSNGVTLLEHAIVKNNQSVV